MKGVCKGPSFAVWVRAGDSILWPPAALAANSTHSGAYPTVTRRWAQGITHVGGSLDNIKATRRGQKRGGGESSSAREPSASPSVSSHAHFQPRRLLVSAFVVFKMKSWTQEAWEQTFLPCSSVSFLPSVLLSAWLGKSPVVGDSCCGACGEGFVVRSPRVGGEGEGRGLVGGRESPACRVEGRDWRCDPGPAGGTSGISAWWWRCWPHGVEGRSRGAAPRGSPSQAAPGGRVGTRVGEGAGAAAAWIVLSPNCSAGEMQSEPPQGPTSPKGRNIDIYMARRIGREGPPWNLFASPKSRTITGIPVVPGFLTVHAEVYHSQANRDHTSNSVYLLYSLRTYYLLCHKASRNKLFIYNIAAFFFFLHSGMKEIVFRKFSKLIRKVFCIICLRDKF